MQLEDFSTHDLIEELKFREGVETSILGPTTSATVTAVGPAIVLVVID